jgi:hypothetical protein
LPLRVPVFLIDVVDAMFRQQLHERDLLTGWRLGGNALRSGRRAHKQYARND